MFSSLEIRQGEVGCMKIVERPSTDVPGSADGDQLSRFVDKDRSIKDVSDDAEIDLAPGAERIDVGHGDADVVPAKTFGLERPTQFCLDTVGADHGAI